MKKIFSIIFVLSCLSGSYAQIGIKANNTAPIASAQLEVQSATKAFYPTRMTTAQRTTMPNPPQAGAMVFDTDLNGLFVFNGSSWVSGSGLTLPYFASQSSARELISITNTNINATIPTIRAETNSLNGSEAIVGYSNNLNATGFTTGISGYNLSNNGNNPYGCGVYGEHTGVGRGVSGYSSYGIGVSGISQGIGGFFSGPANGYALITESGNVGIGIPAPLEKLHVSGNIRASSLAGTGVRDVKANANGTLITTAQTYTISIAPQAFKSRYNTSGTFTNSGAYGDCYMSVGSTDNLIAGMSLPDGATITSVVVYYINMDNTKKFYASLTASPLAAATNFDLFEGTTTAISTSATNVLSYTVPNSGGGSVINNSSNIYYL